MHSNYADISPEFGVLASRAWATQEWLLSGRMIFYTKGCIVWSCKVITQRKTGGSFLTTARNLKWKLIVEIYSSRFLTNASDRLIALECLRREIQKKTKDTYWFGIWKNATSDQLVWSWASTMHGVRSLSIKKAKNVCNGIRFDDEKRILTILSQLKKVSKITPMVSTDQSPYDSISDRLASARYETFREELRYEQTSGMVGSLRTESDEIIGWDLLDEGCSTASISEMYCLALMTRKSDLVHPTETTRSVSKRTAHSGWQEDWVLLLQELPMSDHAYVRVGAGKVFWKSWFHDEAVQRVRIL
ncbi:uncharacterized protein BDZ99DRAFT_556073 [Mytilinidion resinicola]|uniref:HET-domain-containing protein n=1 Tax=Mytilinidion resinicola TaxID=574789 RepID=A0A6A6YX51_9PEZI|nr:uncharacterized protein BDZ99DRAFT_556073 [Mytilinidion resinicola]KAF2812983.1 hypothetical protein BDZ99DRAFT_556073 [Mytilinidion resinicola]